MHMYEVLKTLVENVYRTVAENCCPDKTAQLLLTWAWQETVFI